MALLSISLDLAGSTAAKNRIVRACTTLEHAHEQFQAMTRGFYRVETALYSHLLSERVPLASIFHVKSIGDEIWVVVEVPDAGPSDAFNAVAVGVLRAAIAVACKTVSFSYFSRPLTEREEEADPPKGLRRRSVSLPVKVYVDLIDEAVETSALRLDTFERDVQSIVRGASGGKRPATAEAERAASREVLERLGGFACASAAIAYRTDYIGPEIDHFFRCAKKAIRRRILVGEWFLARLCRADRPATLRRKKQTPEISIGHAVYRFDIDSRIHLKVKPDLKGFGEDYDAYVLREPSIEAVIALSEGGGPRAARRAAAAAPPSALPQRRRARTGTSSQGSRARGAP